MEIADDIFSIDFHIYEIKWSENDRIRIGVETVWQMLDGSFGRIFVSPEYHRKGFGLFMMQKIEAMFPEVKEFYLDTPIWNYNVCFFENDFY